MVVVCETSWRCYLTACLFVASVFSVLYPPHHLIKSVCGGSLVYGWQSRGLLNPLAMVEVRPLLTTQSIITEKALCIGDYLVDFYMSLVQLVEQGTSRIPYRVLGPLTT